MTVVTVFSCGVNEVGFNFFANFFWLSTWFQIGLDVHGFLWNGKS